MKCSMMLDVVLSNRFKKDMKLARKRGYDMNFLDDVVSKLQRQEPLSEKNLDHALSGDYLGFRECHIQLDLLLVIVLMTVNCSCFCHAQQEHILTCFHKMIMGLWNSVNPVASTPWQGALGRWASGGRLC